MIRNTSHIILIIAVLALSFFGFGCIVTSAQEISYAERWTEERLNVLPLYHKDTVTLCFIGDIMMHASQLENAADGEGGFDFSSYFRFLEERMRAADLAVANMEFPLAGEPYTGYPSFSAPDEIAEYAAECGIDVFLAANNHIFDKGRSGAERTARTYRRMNASHGTLYTGLASDRDEMTGNYPLMTSIRGMRIALLNFTYATNGGRRDGWPGVNYMDDRDSIAAAVRRAERKGADIIIALPHWGEEYHLIHSGQQEEMAGWLADEGIDVIIGTHPHVPQDCGFIRKDEDKTVPVVYSLGNAVSNMSAPNTQMEMMAELKVVRHQTGEIEILPPRLTCLWCSRPGGFNDKYTVIPVMEFIGRRELWKGGWDYDKMMSTYDRVKKATGIEDQVNIR